MPAAVVPPVRTAAVAVLAAVVAAPVELSRVMLLQHLVAVMVTVMMMALGVIQPESAVGRRHGALRKQNFSATPICETCD